MKVINQHSGSGTMDDVVENFRALKISAYKKASKLSPYVHDVTLGPESLTCRNTKPEDETPMDLSKSCDIKSTSITKISPFKKLLAEVEMQRVQDVQRALNYKQKQLQNFQKQQNLEHKQNWHNQQKVMIQQMEQLEAQIRMAQEEYDKDASARQQERTQYYQELAIRRKRYDEQLQAKEQRKKELYGIIDQIKKNQSDFCCVHQEITDIIRANVIDESIRKNVVEIFQQLKIFTGQMDEIIKKCKTEKISESEIHSSHDLLQQLILTKSKLEMIFDEHKKQQESIKEQEIKTVESASKQNEENVNVNVQIDKFVSKSSFRFYSELQSFLESHVESYKQLMQDDAYKQFKFDCKKAVNIPVNAISAVTTQHLYDKYIRLSHLLSGKVVQIGDSQVCAIKHPKGVLFCSDLLAKKFVLQGDLMISSNPEAAFCYAAVILALWNEFPYFGKLLLAYFHKMCPYLVPIYLPKTIEQTDEDYYKSLGYQYTDGAVEKQDKFLKRMTGIMRLYFAILISKPRKGQKAVHSHGLPQAWRWMASVLNLEPCIDITATMLHVFLETTGFMMQNTYGKEFQKMINFIIEHYLPLVKKIDSGGPVTRLEVLLQEYRKTGHFNKPNGLLPDGFW